MGTTPYQILDKYGSLLSANENNIILEIGSERGEGSTGYLNTWAKKYNIDFYSVDVVNNNVGDQLAHTGVKFQIAESGHAWCRDILPTLNKKIKVMYLDNFDWIDPTNLQYKWMDELIHSYKERGVIMNNVNCQEEHRMQSSYCIPYLDEQCIVIFDDTWISHITPSGYDGKCGTALPLFLDANFSVKLDSKNRLFAYRGLTIDE